MTQTTGTPVATDENTDKKKSIAGLIAVLFLLFGLFSVYKEFNTVWQIVKHSIMLVVWFYFACVGLLGGLTLWGARNRSLGFKDYTAILLAPLGLLAFAYKGAKTINTVRGHLTGHQRETTNA